MMLYLWLVTAFSQLSNRAMEVMNVKVARRRTEKRYEGRANMMARLDVARTEEAGGLDGTMMQIDNDTDTWRGGLGSSTW